MSTRIKSLSIALALAGLWLLAPRAQAEQLAFVLPHLFGPNGLVVDSEATLPSGATHSAHFNAAFQSNFTQFNTALASQLASLPLPSPAGGFTYTFDQKLGVFKRTTESFGPILADRYETIGKHKLNLGFSYESFTFDTMEGIDLNNIDAVFTHDSPAAGTGRDDLVTTENSLRISASRFTTFLTFGLSDRLDVSVALPVVAMDLNAISYATVRRIGTAANPLVHFFEDPNGGPGSIHRFQSTGSASGIGDVTLRAKASLIRGASGGLALGADVRLPTGDELDFLGSGTIGVKPFLATSFSTKVGERRLSPHLNLGYLWNGNSVLAGNVVTGEKKRLPAQILYSAGLDLGVNEHLTLAADLIGRTVRDSQRLQAQTFTALDGHSQFPDIRFEQASFTTLDGAVGLKVHGGGRFLVDMNLVFKLNNAGLRDAVVPLVGLEYGF